MQIRYKFYFGGDSNPFQKERDAVYDKITAERAEVDPNNEKSLSEVFPTLESWPDYVLSNSKSVFWQMERAIQQNELTKASEIEDLWNEAKSDGSVGEWLKLSEADESEKALCFYIASLYNQFNPNDNTVDFRLYISEGPDSDMEDTETRFSLTPYE